MTFVDPVCPMDMNEAETAATSTFKDQTIIFVPSCAVIAFWKIQRDS